MVGVVAVAATLLFTFVVTGAVMGLLSADKLLVGGITTAVVAVLFGLGWVGAFFVVVVGIVGFLIARASVLLSSSRRRGHLRLTLRRGRVELECGVTSKA